MSNLYKLNNCKIYFFEKTIVSQYDANPLKEFLYFLKYKGHDFINFSFSADKNCLHDNLSVKENFILDAIPTSLIKDGENNLNDFIERIGNPHVRELILLIGNLNEKIHNLPEEKKKLVSLTKAIISQSQFMFLDTPDNNISNETLQIVKKCVHHEAKLNNRIILIKSDRKILWPDIVTNIITKNKDFTYSISKNPLLKSNQSAQSVQNWDKKKVS